MIWKPQFTINREEPVKKVRETEVRPQMHGYDNIQQDQMRTVSDLSNFIVTSTTIDLNKMSPERKVRFIEDHIEEMLAIDKFSALANTDKLDQLRTKLLWLDVKFSKQYKDMYDMRRRAENKTLEILHVYNESRGFCGGFQNALITTRQELSSKIEQEEQRRRKGLLGGFMRKEPPLQQGSVNSSITAPQQ